MKTVIKFILLLALTGPGSLLLAQGGPPPHAGAGRQAKVSADLSSIEHFLAMNDAQLDQVQQAVARVRAMSPAERAVLRERLLAFRKLPESERQAVRAGTGWLNDQDRKDWPMMMRSLDDKQRQAIQAEIQALSNEERAARKHALLEAWRAKR